MSWLARSLVNSLRADNGVSDDDDDDNRSPLPEEEQQPKSPARGVKEDLSELTQTLTRQLWGVASFLAPTPPPPDPSPSDSSAAPDYAAAAEAPRFAAIRSDFAEIGGRVRSGISMLSSNMAASEISKIASTLFGSDEDDDEEWEAGAGAAGVTEEVLGFVRNISMHLETWLDFPLLADYHDSDDFHMSDAQQEHALAIEHLVPRLAALRIELCPSHMNEGCFWKIYFVLLHPRLSKHDADLLSTSQIVQAREMLLSDLQIRTRPNSESPDIDASYEETTALVASEKYTGSQSIFPDKTTSSKAHTPEESTTPVPSTELENDKHPIQTTEATIIEKSVTEEEPITQAKSKDIPCQRDDEDGDEWLEEETGEVGVSGGNAVHLGDEEDVTFSDLEVDDEDEGMHVSSGTKRRSFGSPSKKESGWVELDKGSEGAVRSGDSSSPQTRESNDWLDVDIDAV